jgi:DnaJ like chaperone protein
MFIKSNNSNYKILEVDKNCTNSELKKAYRDLAKKHHPDKVQHLGEAYTKSAKEKFSRIQSAYESIKKQRGIA